MLPDITISTMVESDIDALVDTFAIWNKQRPRFESYIADQQRGERIVVLAKHGDKAVGYGALHWESFDLTFRERNIPEIIDLNVITAYQRQGIATAMIRACEEIARDRGYNIIGIGVELLPQYDHAQRLYRQLGYTPVEGVRPGTVLALCKSL